jgi:predicted Zn-dependent peptidase
VIPEGQRQLVDGVTVLNVGASSGWHSAFLVFRAGRFDETLPTGGITHLVEHLCFSGPGRPEYQFNAAVGGRFTTFFMESSAPADVADFVATVCRGLAEDHPGRLEQEKRVLMTEAAGRGGAGALGSCLIERYGAAGPGLLGYEEFGLRKLTWEQVAAWRSHWFIAENAVLCIHGEIPANLRIDLPRGQIPEMAALLPLAVQVPAFTVTGRDGGIGMSLVGGESPAFPVTLDILERRLMTELRHDRGLSYSVQGASEYLDAHLRHAWLAADALPEQTDVAADVMLGSFEKLADSGCTSEELAGARRRARDAYWSPTAPVHVMHRQAEQILFQQPPRDPSDSLRLIGEVTCEDVASAARGLHDQLIVATPHLIPAVQDRMPRLPMWSATAVEGGARYRMRGSEATLTIGDEGVMITAEPGKFAAVHANQVAALVKWSDAKLTLIGTDGFSVLLDPDDWDGAGNALRMLEDRTDPDLVVTIDAPGPPGWRPAPRHPARAGAGGNPASRPPLMNDQMRVFFQVLWVCVIVGSIVITSGNTIAGVTVIALAILGILGGALVLYRRR